MGGGAGSRSLVGIVVSLPCTAYHAAAAFEVIPGLARTILLDHDHFLRGIQKIVINNCEFRKI